ncbi:hypothetical protein MAHJHV51_56960 [Mycobacterium avium subsp. hominissuis]
MTSAPTLTASTPISAPELTAWPVGTALHQPVWSYRGPALVAVTENQRVAEVAAAARSSATSATR